MTPFAADLLVLFRRDLRCFIREVELFPDDATLWKTLPGISNSAGNLALHVAGNLRHFVGGVLGGTGYQRNREQEFGQREGTRMAVSAALEAASVDIQAGLEKLTPESQAAPFPVSVGGRRCSSLCASLIWIPLTIAASAQLSGHTDRKNVV